MVTAKALAQGDGFVTMFGALTSEPGPIATKFGAPASELDDAPVSLVGALAGATDTLAIWSNLPRAYQPHPDRTIQPGW